MHPQWQQFLEARGANFGTYDGTPCVASFAAEVMSCDYELTDLSCLGQLRIEGPDAAKFFQGYATADVSRLSAGTALVSALCTREGRTIATFRLWGTSNALRLRLHRGLILPVRDLLARYIALSKAEFMEPGDAVVGLGLAGPGSAEAVASIIGRAPVAGEIVCQGTAGGERVALRNRGDLERYELWLPQTDAPATWDALAPRARLVPFSRWLAHSIRAGHVHLSPGTAGEYVPQALNLQALGLIAFDKGCYLGQEVIARLQYRGHLKRRLYRFSLSTAQQISLGASVHAGATDGEVVGEVVAATTDQGRCELLAVIRADRAHAPLFTSSQPLLAEPLPYEVPEPGTTR